MFVYHFAFGQQKDFLDIFLNKTKKRKAEYYRLTELKDSLKKEYIIETYYITNEKLDSGTYILGDSLILNGIYKRWSKTAELIIDKKYRNGKEVSRYRPERKPDEEEVYTYVSPFASYPGGPKKLKEFIQTNVIYPEKAKKKGLQGTVYLRFIVKADGSIGSIQLMQGVNPLLDDEAIKVIRKIEKMKPGATGGRNVNVWYHMPVEFNFEE